jgi:hypothetical protein
VSKCDEFRQVSRMVEKEVLWSCEEGSKKVQGPEVLGDCIGLCATEDCGVVRA